MVNKKKASIVGGAVTLLGLLTAGYFMCGNHDVSPLKNPATQESTTKNTFMEDKTDSMDKVDIEQAKKATEDIAELHENLQKAVRNTNPNFINVNGHKYYIFGEDILLPVDSAWSQYDIPASKDGSYDTISEFYYGDESMDNWTQKLTIHKVKGFDNETSTEFMERLQTGVLVTLSDRMALLGETVSKDNTSFNYAKKTDNECLMYWGVKGLGEVQFVRVFRSEYTNNLYVATSNFKMDINDVDTEFAGNKLAELKSIQQLKKKGQ